MNNNFKLILCILLPLSVGTIAGLATSGSIDGWYQQLDKPTFNPPGWLFGPVWSILYILMGISFYLIVRSPATRQRKKAIVIFCVQLLLNFCWSFLFFKFHLLAVAFIEILLIWICILMMIIAFKKINPTAAFLQIPYLVWVSFATVLNGTIWLLN